MTPQEQQVKDHIGLLEGNGERPTVRALARMSEISSGRMQQILQSLFDQGEIGKDEHGTVTVSSPVPGYLQEARALVEKLPGVEVDVGTGDDGQTFLKLTKRVHTIHPIGEKGIPVAAAVTRGTRALREIPDRV